MTSSVRRPSNYDRFPTVPVPPAYANDCWRGWDAVVERLRAALEQARASRGRRIVLAVECYPGVHDDDLRTRLAQALRPARTIDVKTAFKSPAEIEAMLAPDLGGDDPVFGCLTRRNLDEFLDPAKTAELRRGIASGEGAGFVLAVGPAASLVAEPDVFVYADLPRWEGQLRQRRGEVDNLGTRNRGLKAALQYKRSFFVDWRVADRVKRSTMARWDFLLDTTVPADPKLIGGEAHLAALRHCTTRPFRVVPFFDPGPWGGQWMKEICNLDRGAPNYAWCFDCVPEENSLLLEFAGGVRVEIPALNLVLREPRALLGEAAHGRFGAEFPIRFDLLDTMGGGNLSFQVHPTLDYAAEHFGLRYTQDESYYLLDAAPDGVVYLGRKTDATPAETIAALEAAQRGGAPFAAERFAARFPARAHDHFLIPAGTLHCSGAGSMVLEISATPYIFTFKLWDWGRLGLDGQPRPMNIERAKHVIAWERDEDYARTRLVNRVVPLASGEGWREERTGLHEAEFIETRRHWFTGPVPHDTRGNLNVLNLVAGADAIVESPSGAFEPFPVHYAETWIVPAAVGAYTVRPGGATPPTGRARELATIKAFVRAGP